MKVKCPWCGAAGTDVRPSPEGVGGAYRKGQEDYAFEVRGNYAGRPVRKCLKCGNGVRVSFLPPRFKKVSPEEWEYLQERWTEFKAQMEADKPALEERRAQARRKYASGDTDTEE